MTELYRLSVLESCGSAWIPNAKRMEGSAGPLQLPGQVVWRPGPDGDDNISQYSLIPIANVPSIWLLKQSESSSFLGQCPGGFSSCRVNVAGVDFLALRPIIGLGVDDIDTEKSIPLRAGDTSRIFRWTHIVLKNARSAPDFFLLTELGVLQTVFREEGREKLASVLPASNCVVSALQ